MPFVCRIRANWNTAAARTTARLRVSLFLAFDLIFSGSMARKHVCVSACALFEMLLVDGCIPVMVFPRQASKTSILLESIFWSSDSLFRVLLFRPACIYLSNSSVRALVFPLFLFHASGQHISALHPRVRSEIDRLVAPDLQVYHHAARLFEQQVCLFISSSF